MNAFAYPQDGGLKAQVRSYAETQSLNDVLEAELRAQARGDTASWMSDAERRNIAQQQDPAHDQSAFKTTSVWVSSEGDVLTRDELPPGPPSLHGMIYTRAGAVPIEATQVHIAFKDEIPPLVSPQMLDDLRHLDVSGTYTAYFENSKLFKAMEKSERRWSRYLDRQLYGPRWARELRWIAHNLLAHPLAEITHWLGYIHPRIRDFGLWLHDVTVPPHAPNTGRG